MLSSMHNIICSRPAEDVLQYDTVIQFGLWYYSIVSQYNVSALTCFSNVLCMSSITFALSCFLLTTRLVVRRKMGLSVLFLNVHELMSAGSQESSGRHLLRTLVSEKLEWILEHGASA